HPQHRGDADGARLHGEHDATGPNHPVHDGTRRAAHHSQPGRAGIFLSAGDRDEGIGPTERRSPRKLGENDRMKWDNASVLAFVAGVLAMAGAGSAYAGERSGCLRLAIAADASVQARWPDLEDVIRD